MAQTDQEHGGSSTPLPLDGAPAQRFQRVVARASFCCIKLQATCGEERILFYPQNKKNGCQSTKIRKYQLKPKGWLYFQVLAINICSWLKKKIKSKQICLVGGNMFTDRFAQIAWHCKRVGWGFISKSPPRMRCVVYIPVLTAAN